MRIIHSSKLGRISLIYGSAQYSNGQKVEMNISQQVQAAYDQLVDAYVERNHNAIGDFLTKPIRDLSKHVGAQGNILDLGCGTGRDMALFESQGVNVIGGDLSGGMLTFAQQQVSSPLTMLDMQRIPFTDSVFEGVWSCASLLHIPKADAPAVLREVWRVLRTGGMLILSVQEGDSESWDGGYAIDVQRFFARYRPAEMQAMLTQTGFVVESLAREMSGTKVWLRFTCLKQEM